MAVQNPTVTIHSGDDKRLNYTVKDGAGAVVVITGATLKWGLSRKKTGEVAPIGGEIVSKSTGSGITITDGDNGELRVDLDAADTAPLRGSHYHELEMVLGGKRSTLAYGQVEILVDLLE